MSDDRLFDNISDTARWTAAYRAEESESPRPSFCDPYARSLAGEKGFEIVRRVNRPIIRFQVVVRTALIDELVVSAIRERGVDAVLALAAGLDTRPYRLDLPSGLKWIEVDLPDLISYKDKVMTGENPNCVLERIPLDLVDPVARRGLFRLLDAEAHRVLVLSEGLLSYLDSDAVAGLADDLHACNHFVEWVTELAGAQVLQGRRGATHDLDTTMRFAPAEGTSFFLPHGWREAEYHDMFDEGRRFNHDILMAWLFRAARRLLPPERARPFERVIGVVRFERE